MAFTFLASSLLPDIQNAKPGEAVPHTTEQEIESFAWVFVFVVYKHALEDPNVILKYNKWISLKEEFNCLFPGLGGSATSTSKSASVILTARYIMHSPDSNQHILQHIQTHAENHADHFCDLFECIWEVLVSQLPRANVAKKSLIKARVASHLQLPPPVTVALPLPLVHDDILALFEGYLELVEEAKAGGNSRRIP